MHELTRKIICSKDHLNRGITNCKVLTRQITHIHTLGKIASKTRVQNRILLEYVTEDFKGCSGVAKCCWISSFVLCRVMGKIPSFAECQRNDGERQSSRYYGRVMNHITNPKQTALHHPNNVTTQHNMSSHRMLRQYLLKIALLHYTKLLLQRCRAVKGGG
jgi:hypothetical protein